MRVGENRGLDRFMDGLSVAFVVGLVATIAVATWAICWTVATY